jgi:hypothetical protein
MNDGIGIISTAHPVSNQPMKRKRDAKGRFLPWISPDSLVTGEIDFSGPPIGLKQFARGRLLLDKEQKK